MVVVVEALTWNKAEKSYGATLDCWLLDLGTLVT